MLLMAWAFLAIERIQFLASTDNRRIFWAQPMYTAFVHVLFVRAVGSEPNGPELSWSRWEMPMHGQQCCFTRLHRFMLGFSVLYRSAQL